MLPLPLPLLSPHFRKQRKSGQLEPLPFLFLCLLKKIIEIILSSFKMGTYLRMFSAFIVCSATLHFYNLIHTES